MQDPNYSSYDQQEYDAPAVPYIPYESSTPVAPSDQWKSSESSVPDTPYLRAYPAADAIMPVAPPSYTSPASYGGPDYLNVEYGSVPFAPETEKVTAVPPKKSRRRLWIVLASLVVLLAILGTSGFFLWSYVNRSTPMKTLDAFCNALQKEQYTVAYQQFSKDLQSKFSSDDFSSILSQDKVVTCSHGVVGDSGTTATTSLKLVHSSKGVNDDLVYLTKDDQSNWKINDLKKAGSS